MPRHFVLAFILVSTGIVASQQPSARPRRLAPLQNHSQEAPKSPESTAHPKYLAKPFDINASNVSPNFVGNDIVNLTRRVEESVVLKPKSEFESTDEYERRKANFRSRALYGTITPDSHLAFVMGHGLDSGPKFSYDADGQALTASLIDQDVTYSLSEGDPEMDTVPVQSMQTHRGKYIGSNAFGAKVEVTKTYAQEYGLAFEPRSWVFPFATDVFRREFSTVIPMSSKKARVVKANVKMVMVCKLTEPWYRKLISHYKATIDSPYDQTIEMHFLQVQPEQIWIIDGSTGEVLTRVSEESLKASAN